MRKVFFQLYTFFTSESARNRADSEGSNELHPYSHKGCTHLGQVPRTGFFDLANV